MEKHGRITLDAGANVWPHELLTAKALADAGYDVHFIRGCDAPRMSKADAIINGQVWEMKSPETKNPKRLTDIMNKALHQSPRVVVDTRRMPGVSNQAAQHELERCVQIFRSLRSLIWIGKGECVVLLK